MKVVVLFIGRLKISPRICSFSPCYRRKSTVQFLTNKTRKKTEEEEFVAEVLEENGEQENPLFKPSISSAFQIAGHTLFMEDGNTVAAKRFISKNPAVLAFNPLHGLEVRNGLRLRVHRGEIDKYARTAALRRLENAIVSGRLAHVPLPWTNAFRKAEQLSEDYAEHIGSRSADTLHVAAALLAGARRILSFNKRQCELAKAAGLEVKP